MFGVRYVKATPTTYVLQFKNGRAIREGAGLAFLYYAPSTTLVMVPLASADVPFVFNETTADFQALTIQGQLTFRIADAKRTAALLDYSVAPSGKYCSEDPAQLKERLVHVTQILTRAALGSMALRAALGSSAHIVASVLAGLAASETVQRMGVEILGMSILSMKPTPERARALEAEAREALQRKSDEAIYERRNASVEQERRIKESELSTEIAVEEKKRQIRETQMGADIAVEQQRAELINSRVANDKKDADARAYALEKTLAPLEKLEWQKLMAITGGGGDPRTMIAVAFRELATNASKIGELNISPELLNSLLKK